MIYDIFRAPLYGWIRQMTGNREDTEDIVAAAFAALLEQKNHFDRMSLIRHFLRNSARNACLNLLARREVARSRSGEVEDFYRHLQAGDDETAEIMEQYMNRLVASINTLPRRSREHHYDAAPAADDLCGDRAGASHLVQDGGQPQGPGDPEAEAGTGQGAYFNHPFIPFAMSRGARIGELMFRHIRNGLSEQEAAELLAWRREKPGNEALFRRQTDPEYLRETIREIYEGREQGLEKLLRQCPPGKSAAPAMMNLSVWKIAAMLLVLTVLYSLLNMDIDATRSSSTSPARQVNFLDANGLSKSLDDIRKDMREGYADGRKARMRNLIREFTAPYSDSAALGLFNTLITHDAGRCLLLLPDGSRCWQNRNSFVAYPVNFFNDTPKLRIRGEAYVESR
jgi:RNA polymerase sigma factor (sigma-70 family)